MDSVGPWDARIYADLAGDVQVRWSATRAEGWVDATDVDLTIEPPDASSNTVRARRYRTTSDGEYVRVSGEIMDANVGSADAMCDRVIIHFTNLPRTSPG